MVLTNAPTSALGTDPQDVVGRLASILTTIFTPYTQAHIRPETTYPDGAGAPLLQCIFPMGWTVIHRIQRDAVDPVRLHALTLEYQRHGIDVVWWLGGAANTRANRLWSVNTFGMCFLFDLQQDQLELQSAGRDQVRQEWSISLLNQGKPTSGFDRLITFWIEQALVRYFELWGPISARHFAWALAAPPQQADASLLLHRFNIEICILYQRRFVTKTGEPGLFKPEKLSRIYPYILRWPAEGIRVAKSRIPQSAR